jgi:ribosome recycling factor
VASPTALGDVLAQTEGRMKKAIEALRRELGTVRTGRAAPALVEQLQVEAYGVPTPLIQLAAISAPEPRLLVIQPWDKSLLKAVEKGILASDLGITPSNDGTLIRVAMPPLSEERRRDLVKVVHRKVEDARVEIRTHRRHAADDLHKKEKDAGVSADEMKRILGELQKLHDRYILQAEEVGQAKEREILER